MVIKHNNPCGAAVADTLAEALRSAPWPAIRSARSARCSGLNRTVDAATAEVLCEPGLFIEAIVAPDFDARGPRDPDHAAEVEGQRAAAEGRAGSDAAAPALGLPAASRAACWCRRPTCWPIPKPTGTWSPTPSPTTAQWPICASPGPWCGTSSRTPSWSAKDRMLLGVGAGQMSRVDSVEIAMKKAGDRGAGARAGLRRLLSLPRFDRAGRRGRRRGGDPAGRLAQRRRGRSPPATSTASPMIFTGRRHFKH